jgi:hypothetical protein
MTGTDADEGVDPGAGGGAGVADAGNRVEAEAGGDDPADGTLDPDAFQALGNEVRLSVLRHLLAREDEGRPATAFSTLQAAAGADSSAGFAYHLRQLTGRYVRKAGSRASDDGDGDGDGEGEGDDEGYVLTYAGRKVARAVAAGTYTESVDLEPVALDDPCPHCGAEGLVARCTDNVVGIACGDCGRPVLSLPFPPQGYRDRAPSAVPAAFDRHHRHRLSLLRDGVCPECAGEAAATVDRPPSAGEDPEAAADGGPDDGRPADRVQATFECGACGYATRTPVTLSLLYHPAVVSFYHDHGVDVRERPLWSVGSEWRETLLSEDPWAVAVSTELDDELLELYVDRSASVVDYRRRPAGS